MDKIQQFRQPMVTATGIFLGFMLDFANGWLPNSFTIYRFRDVVIAGGTLASIALLIVVLYRVLRGDQPEDSASRFYKRTLRLFIIGISIPFFSAVIVVVHKLFTIF
jgi:hypothetical protein